MTKQDFIMRYEMWLQMAILKEIYDRQCSAKYGEGAFDRDAKGFVGIPLSGLTKQMKYISDKPDNIKRILDDMAYNGLVSRIQRNYYNSERQQDEFVWCYKPTDKGHRALDRYNAVNKPF